MRPCFLDDLFVRLSISMSDTSYKIKPVDRKTVSDFLDFSMKNGAMDEMVKAALKLKEVKVAAFRYPDDVRHNLPDEEFVEHIRCMGELIDDLLDSFSEFVRSEEDGSRITSGELILFYNLLLQVKEVLADGALGQKTDDALHVLGLMALPVFSDNRDLNGKIADHSIIEAFSDTPENEALLPQYH